MEPNDESRFFVETRLAGAEVAIVSAVGEVDLHTAARLHEALDGLDEERIKCLVIDLSRCGFIDSTGLGVLIAASKRLHLDDPPTIACTEAVRKVFAVTGLDAVFALCDTLDEALASARPTG